MPLADRRMLLSLRATLQPGAAPTRDPNQHPRGKEIGWNTPRYKAKSPTSEIPSISASMIVKRLELDDRKAAGTRTTEAAPERPGPYQNPLSYNPGSNYCFLLATLLTTLLDTLLVTFTATLHTRLYTPHHAPRQTLQSPQGYSSNPVKSALTQSPKSCGPYPA